MSFKKLIAVITTAVVLQGCSSSSVYTELQGELSGYKGQIVYDNTPEMFDLKNTWKTIENKVGYIDEDIKSNFLNKADVDLVANKVIYNDAYFCDKKHAVILEEIKESLHSKDVWKYKLFKNTATGGSVHPSIKLSSKFTEVSAFNSKAQTTAEFKWIWGKGYSESGWVTIDYSVATNCNALTGTIADLEISSISSMPAQLGLSKQIIGDVWVDQKTIRTNIHKISSKIKRLSSFGKTERYKDDLEGIISLAQNRYKSIGVEKHSKEEFIFNEKIEVLKSRLQRRFNKNHYNKETGRYTLYRDVAINNKGAIARAYIVFSLFPESKGRTAIVMAREVEAIQDNIANKKIENKNKINKTFSELRKSLIAMIS